MAADDSQIDPKTGLAPDEAPTPMWLPLLGAALFLVGLTYVAINASDSPDEPGQAGSGAAADADQDGDSEPASAGSPGVEE